MPKRSAEHMQARRQQILEAAWRCFAREGFHATSMDQVIAEAGLSAGAVYGHFRGKDELIGAGAQEAVGYARHVFDVLLADGAAPSPGTLMETVLSSVVRLAERDGYDLTRLAVQVWGESLRSPDVARVAAGAYSQLREQFTEVARRWKTAGQLPAEADPAAVGQALFALVPGFMVQRLLLQDVEPDRFAVGLAAVAGWRPG